MAFGMSDKEEQVSLIGGKGNKKTKGVIESSIDVVKAQHGNYGRAACWGRKGSVFWSPNQLSRNRVLCFRREDLQEIVSFLYTFTHVSSFVISWNCFGIYHRKTWGACLVARMIGLDTWTSNVRQEHWKNTPKLATKRIYCWVKGQRPKGRFCA